MRNDAYWRNRMKILEESLLDTGYEYVQNIEKQYNLAIVELDKKIAAWYQRFADNNKITLAEAKRLLNSEELKEFKWTVQDYIKHGEENALSQNWVKELENASARVHISRLDSLKVQLRQEAEALHGSQLKGTESLLEGIYRDGYYHTAFEIQKGLGFGWSMQSLSADTLKKVLSRPWTTDNQTFRDRVWTNKTALVNTVNTQLTQMIMRGTAPDKAIKEIAHQFNVSKNKAGRLVMTESAAFASTAQNDCFEALDVERYKIVATFDKETCPLCGELDGKDYKTSEYQVGVTAPPFHPWCRCCTCPYFADMEGVGDRFARAEDGSAYEVPQNMNFQEWYDKTFTKPAEMRYNKFAESVHEELNSYSTVLNVGMQNKHIEGTDNYDSTRSTLTDDPQKLYDLYSGKGCFLQTNSGVWNNKERFTHTSEIGIYRSPSGREMPTNTGLIHYSRKKGWHIVPAKPQKGKR